MKGSLTVEASFVIPLCFLFLGVIFYLGIYQYNQAVLQMTGYECILQNKFYFIIENVLYETK